MRKVSRNQKGFSLIELLIVVAIILIIAAIAVPNLLKSKMAANEASAAASSRTVGTANVTYSSTYNIGFAGTLAQLGPPGTAAASSSASDLIDSVLSGLTPPATPPVKSGYSFTYTAVTAAPSSGTPNGTFSLLSTPIAPNSTGNSTFCLDQSNVVKKDPAGATAGGASTGCGAFTGPPM